jgi:hypothetical protein
MTKRFVHVLRDKEASLDEHGGLWIDPQAITSLEIMCSPVGWVDGKPSAWFIKGMIPGQVFQVPRDMEDYDKAFDTSRDALDWLKNWVRNNIGPGVRFQEE